MQGTGAFLARDSSTVPSPGPRINTCSISHPWTSGRGWKIYLSLLCSYPKSPTYFPLGRSRGAFSSHFWLRKFFSWLEGQWCAWTYYQSPAEWVKMFSEQEIYPTSLKSTMDMSKQHNLLEAFLMANLSHSIWWAWSDIAKAMSHLSTVGRYILLSHLQFHGEPIWNVLLHSPLMCYKFGSVHLLVCLFLFFFFFW